MTTLNDIYPTDDVDDVLDTWVRELMGSTFRSEFKNTETLSATRVLLDADMPIQRFNCNGADRIANMPTADAVNNHPYLVVNSTSSGNYKLTMQDNSGTVTLGVFFPGDWGLFLPDGNGGYFVVNRPFSRVLSPSQVTANQNDWYPTGAGGVDVIRVDTDASRTFTGFGFGAAGKAILVVNSGSNPAVFANESASSSAANRFAFGADLTLATKQAVMMWYDNTSSRWRLVGGAGSGGGGGLTVSVASVTTSNVTVTEDTHFILNLSGLTANRDFALPTPSAAGKRVKMTVSAGDDTYALILKVNSTEVVRSFITGETFEFTSYGTGAGDWVMEDGKIPCIGVMERQTAQSINHNTTAKIALATSVINIGNINDTTNNKITIRRAGNYEISAFVSLGNVFDDQEFLEIDVYVNGALKKFYTSYTSTASTNRYQSPSMTFKIPLAVGDYIELYVTHNEGAAQNTDTTYYPQLSVVELGAGGGGGGGGGGALSDGDYGDVTVGGSGTTITIDNDAVTLAKLVSATAQYKLLGRLSASAGDFEEITGSANVFSFLQAADYAAMRTLLGLVIGTNVQAYDADLDNWAGKTAPSGTVLGTTDTQTLTNKRVTPRVGTVSSSATPTINTDNVDVFTITALAVDITSMTTNLSGTPTDGQKLLIFITGTASRAITWGSSFEASTVALPTTTSGTSRLDVGFIWNAATSKWRCVGYV